MTKTSKRIILSVLTLVLTVVALGTTTFAWFTLSNVSNVSGLEANVTAGDGLEVRINNGTGNHVGIFKNNLSEADFNAYLEDDAENFEFGAVTTLDAQAFTKLGVTDQGKQHLAFQAKANEDYLEFTLEFRSQNAGNVNLTSYVLGGTSLDFTPDQPYKQTNDTETSNTVVANPSNGARISFGTDAYQKPEDPYEINTQDKKITKGNDVSATPQTFGQWSFLATKGVSIFENKDADTALTAPATTWVDAKQTVKENGDTVVELKKAQPKDTYATGKVVVRVWIEGWDADSYDAIFRTTLNVALTFKKQQ